jgi:4-hydroxy-tetrahydrodipicolinate synthase
MAIQLSGIIVPNVTPTDVAGRVDKTGLQKLITYLLDAGVHGLFVGGSAGEGPLLTDKEWQRLMEFTAEFAGSRVPLLAGVQDTSTPRVLERIKIVKKIGYKQCVVTPAYYLVSKSAEEHLHHFGTCVEATDIEVIPYNIPQLTQSAISVDTVCDMARRGWIRHVKDSEGNLANIKAMVQKGGEYGLRILCGNDPISGDALLSGAAGLISGTANMVPELFVNLFAAAKANQREKVKEIQNEVINIGNKVVLAGPSWVPPLKVFAAKRSGGDWGTGVPPCAAISKEQAAQVEKLLEQMRQPA